MKHFYFVALLLATYGGMLAAYLNQYPHLLNGRIDDLFGFTFVMWVLLAAPLAMLFYDASSVARK